MDDDDEFFDTISVSSGVSRRRLDNRDYLSLSRNTVYHSAIDLETMELARLDCEDGSSQNKRWRNFTTGECVDFVLAYDKEGKPNHVRCREIFENNLRDKRLQLETEETQHIHFVKIHVPTEVLYIYAELLKLRLPLQYNEDDVHRGNVLTRAIRSCLDFFHVEVDTQIFPLKSHRWTAEFSLDKKSLFDTDSPDFFSEGVRITIAAYILDAAKYGEDDQDKGIKRLISDGVYKAAYPLHDGTQDDEKSKRYLLLHHWAQLSKCAKYQPIDDIKEYFGVKLALYFAWLGFYTNMLIPASLVGIGCIIYAAVTLNSDTLSQDVCNLDITMCPRCDKVCDYWKLSEGCLYSKIQHFVDNPATIVFAVFMSLWSVFYLEMWKRYSAGIAHRWGLTGFDLDAEPPRPEYLRAAKNVTKQRVDLITKQTEPKVSFVKLKLPWIIFSFAFALVWVFLALSVMFGVVTYRMSLLTSEALFDDHTSYRVYVLPVTAAIINLISINILSIIYRRLAVWLTEQEYQRTQSEYEDSLSLKIYMFQFANYYSSIFYIAFLKGQFVGYPAKYNRIFGYRQEECNPGGCLMELTIQLAIVMVGNQALNAVLEMGVPLLMKIYSSAKLKIRPQGEEAEAEIVTCNQWTEDYKLQPLDSQSLFLEYLEMVLQYGFVTIFVTAFPLAPLFALLNNILEMRLDAKKFLKFFRRPVPQRVKNIGVWFPIMSFIGQISVVSNAFIIALSSHFIPKLVYMLEVSEDHTDIGFLENSLAYFNTSDFVPGAAPENPSVSVEVCRYSAYRNPPNATGGLVKYKRTVLYWHILAARLAFVVAYQNFVTFVVAAVAWAIPDIPRKLNDQIKREAFKTNELIIQKYADEADMIKAGTTVRAFLKKKNRDSATSADTVYYESNGGFHPETPKIENHENS